MIRRSTGYCPNCNAGFWVEAGIFADDLRYRCDKCRSVIDVRIKWGKIKSVSPAPTVKDEYGGHCDPTTPQPKTEWQLTDDKWWEEVGHDL